MKAGFPETARQSSVLMEMAPDNWTSPIASGRPATRANRQRRFPRSRLMAPPAPCDSTCAGRFAWRPALQPESAVARDFV